MHVDVSVRTWSVQKRHVDLRECSSFPVEVVSTSLDVPAVIVRKHFQKLNYCNLKMPRDSDRSATNFFKNEFHAY